MIDPALEELDKINPDNLIPKQALKVMYQIDMHHQKMTKPYPDIAVAISVYNEEASIYEPSTLHLFYFRIKLPLPTWAVRIARFSK